MGTAGFERYVEGGTAGGIPSVFGIAQGFDLGVWLAGTVVPAFAEDAAVPYEHGTNHRVGRVSPRALRASARALRMKRASASDLGVDAGERLGSGMGRLLEDDRDAVAGGGSMDLRVRAVASSTR